MFSDSDYLNGLLTLYVNELYFPEVDAAFVTFVNRVRRRQEKQRESRNFLQEPLPPVPPQLAVRNNQWRKQRLEAVLRQHEADLLPLLKRQQLPWSEARAATNFLEEFRRAMDEWSSRTRGLALPEPHTIDFDPVVAGGLPEGGGFIGRQSDYERIVRSQEIARLLKTAKNIASGPLGALGYFLGGDAGSDLGALLDQAAGGASRIGGARSQHAALNRQPAYRPQTQQVAPPTQSGSRAVDNRAIDGRATTAPLGGPQKPQPAPPSPVPALPTPAPASAPASAPPASASRPAQSAGGAKGSGGGTPPPPPIPSGGPPRTLVQKLRDMKIDVNDPYTMRKINEIYQANRDPNVLLTKLRSGSGELRVIAREARYPNVALVRFVPSSNRQRTPDIEVFYRNGRRLYVEVRTVTEAHRGDTVATARGQRAPLHGMFEKSVEDKLRRGQLSSTNPGKIVIDAPYQKIDSTALEGWRDMMARILARAPMPAGVNGVEVTGGGTSMLIFRPPGWRGVLVH